MAKRFTRLNGENMLDFQRRITLLQASEKPLSMCRQPAKPRRTRRSTTHNNQVANRIDGFDRDDIGPSED